jgi:hypothetical protein
MLQRMEKYVFNGNPAVLSKSSEFNGRFLNYAPVITISEDCMMAFFVFAKGESNFGKYYIG